MTNARDRVLADIRRALQQPPRELLHETVPAAQSVPEVLGRSALIAQFAERVAEYKAWVGECTATQLAETVATRLAVRGSRFVASTDFPGGIVSQELLVPDAGLSYEEIAATDGVVSLAAVGIAQTGTIVLDGGVGQGRRAITLLPDYHLCVVYAEQIVADVPAAIGAVRQAVVEQRVPLTFISGPSATSDIELNRVEGVHGPRTLEVIIVV